jgi:multicomponent Na+:H+ antiporter subunit E
MSTFLVNLILALIWTAITGSFSFANLVFGFVLAAFAIYLVRSETRAQHYFSRTWRILSLAWLFIVELVKSAVKVAITVMSPNMELKPGFITYPLKVDRDLEITLLANLITLTPGTLSVDVSEDRKQLFIHALDCSDPESIRDDIANGFERRILEAFR